MRTVTAGPTLNVDDGEALVAAVTTEALVWVMVVVAAFFCVFF